MSGSGPIYEYQRELTAKLEQALRERDEARAELRTVAERQREACAQWVADYCSDAKAAGVRALPLVTEVKP